MIFIHSILVFLQFVSGIALITAVTMQESKNDGLTGQIGTVATSSFKGKAGREEQLNQATKKIAAAFFLISILVFLGSSR